MKRSCTVLTKALGEPDVRKFCHKRWAEADSIWGCGESWAQDYSSFGSGTGSRAAGLSTRRTLRVSRNLETVLV